MNHGPEWVLFTYRLPREPSTPRAALWRSLRRIGAAQIVDGLVALPDLERTREQIEWLAQTVRESGGDATVWTASLSSAAERSRLIGEMTAARSIEYAAIAESAHALLDVEGADAAARRRSARLLRREIHRVIRRDYFPSGARDTAQVALDALDPAIEVPS